MRWRNTGKRVTEVGGKKGDKIIALNYDSSLF